MAVSFENLTADAIEDIQWANLAHPSQMAIKVISEGDDLPSHLKMSDLVAVVNFLLDLLDWKIHDLSQVKNRDELHHMEKIDQNDISNADQDEEVERFSDVKEENDDLKEQSFKMELHEGYENGIDPFDESSDKSAADVHLFEEENHQDQEEEKVTPNDSNGQIWCGKCDQVFSTPAEMKAHVVAMHDVKMQCFKCGKVFLKKGDLTAHMKTHSTAKCHICPECGKEFNVKSYLKRHIDDMHNLKEKPFVCTQCGKTFPIQSALNKHMKRIHSEERPFACSSCDKTYKRSTHLKTHIQMAHPEESKVPAVDCPVCGKKFECMARLRMHEVVHTGEKKFECLICGQRFKEKKSVKRHEKLVHQGERPFACTVCDKKYRDKYGLNHHMEATHSTQKPFKCQQCDREFAFKDHLEKHVKRDHEGLKPFRCTQCDKEFFTPGQLKVHQQVHMKSQAKMLGEAMFMALKEGAPD